MATAASTSQRERVEQPGRDEGRSTASSGDPAFSELVLAHDRWMLAHWPYRRPRPTHAPFAPSAWPDNEPGEDVDGRDAVERDYREKLEAFERREGKIVQAYWCISAPSAVALTERPARQAWRREPRIRLHRASDWLTNGHPTVSELLHHCDTLAIKIGEILRGTAKRIALEWVFSAEGYLLGIADQATGKAAAKKARDGGDGETRAADAGDARERQRPARDPLIAHARNEVLEIERYYARAASKVGRIVYFQGMLLGAVLLTILSIGIGTALWALDRVDYEAQETTLFFAAYASGALGALVSVMSRMRFGGFSVDYEVGRQPLRALGAIRPVIGAVFGLAVYFAIQGGLLQIKLPDETGGEFYFYAFVGFLAGFSERWTQVILGGAERTIARTLGDDDKGRSEQRTGDGERRWNRAADDW